MGRSIWLEYEGGVMQGESREKLWRMQCRRSLLFAMVLALAALAIVSDSCSEGDSAGAQGVGMVLLEKLK